MSVVVDAEGRVRASHVYPNSDVPNHASALAQVKNRTVALASAALRQRVRDYAVAEDLHRRFKTDPARFDAGHGGGASGTLGGNNV